MSRQSKNRRSVSVSVEAHDRMLAAAERLGLRDMPRTTGVPALVERVIIEALARESRES